MLPTYLEAERVVAPILGLSLGGCGAQQLERSLRSLPGVFDVYVNPASEAAYVTYDTARIARADLQRAIEVAGYRTVDPAAWCSLP